MGLWRYCYGGSGFGSLIDQCLEAMVEREKERRERERGVIVYGIMFPAEYGGERGRRERILERLGYEGLS